MDYLFQKNIKFQTTCEMNINLNILLSFYINRINKIFKEQIGDLVDAVIILDNPLACFNRNNLKMYHKVL
ncbi:hypothetical protein, partial [Desulfobacterium sp. N47]|uniref:hypothetical protein n=1 Tax=Desulfobacterium sp. N47 TaxID=3115210 RepID=UPI003F49B564